MPDKPRRGGGKAHLAASFGWLPAQPGERRVILASALGMATPVLLGWALGALPLGLVAALGGLMVSNAPAAPSLAELAQDLGQVALAAILAALAALVLAGHGGWTDLAMVLLGGVAALAGGYSRVLAAGSLRFLIFFLITLNLAQAQGGFPAWLLAPLVAGGAWTAALRIGFAALDPATSRAAVSHAPMAHAGERLGRWWRLLGQFEGWQFALRLTPGLALAGLLRGVWPGHHLLWIAMTVALLSQRQLEWPPLRATQRAIGALLGVGASLVLLSGTWPSWALALLVAALAALLPWLRRRNYLAYTAGITPLIILLVEAGGPLQPGLLEDRLLATLVGAAAVIAADALVRRVPR